MSEARDMMAEAVADLCGEVGHGDPFIVSGIRGRFVGVFNGLTASNTPSVAGFEVGGSGSMTVPKGIAWQPKSGQTIYKADKSFIVASVTDEPTHYSITLTAP